MKPRTALPPHCGRCALYIGFTVENIRSEGEFRLFVT